MAQGAQDNGICPHCQKRFGPPGHLCSGEDCKEQGYHFIPKAWFESARDFAFKRGKPVDPLLGRKIERYFVVGKLGEGGMGAVYLAWQEPLGREVALKLISGLELTDEVKARFEREARAISVLDHPNIVKLHDYGIANIGFELPFMALEKLFDDPCYFWPLARGRPRRRSLCISTAALCTTATSCTTTSGCGVCAEHSSELVIWSFRSGQSCLRLVFGFPNKPQAISRTPRVRLKLG